jgi:hypothetical protein
MSSKNIIIMLVLFLLLSCTPKTIQDGDIVQPPYGYSNYCKDNPKSIFCKEQ